MVRLRKEQKKTTVKKTPKNQPTRGSEVVISGRTHISLIEGREIVGLASDYSEPGRTRLDFETTFCYSCFGFAYAFLMDYGNRGVTV